MTGLSDAHRRMLEVESAILPEIIAERGDHTVTNADELKTAGYKPAQIRLPALGQPLHTVDGQPGPLVIRPDNPRVEENRAKRNPDGSYPQKVIKYDFPKGEHGRLDCHPRSRRHLGNPAIRLIVTEGQKKGDSILSAAERAGEVVCVISLLGIWNWRGKNELGGATVLADWEYVTLKDREVWLIFDADYQSNPNVRLSLDRLSKWLTGRGAKVRVLYLPGGASGKGVDDYLALGHTWADLVGLLQLPAPEPKAAPPQVELLDDAPLTLSRPLGLVGGHAWAATWLHVKRTETEFLDERSGKIIQLREPRVTVGQELFIVRDDGRVFGAGADDLLEATGLTVTLADAPPSDKLWTTAGVRRYRAGERAEPADVFNRLVEVVTRFIDFDRSLAAQETMAEFIACYVLSTWLSDAFQVLGFLWPNGERGSGKTNLLHVAAQLSYLGIVVMSGGSFASLRDLADYGAFLAFDDAEELTDPRKSDPDKRALMLAGNRRGAFVTVKEPNPDKRTWRTRYVNAYCPRAFSAIRLPDPVLASRTIIVPLIRTTDAGRGNADPLDAAVWPCDRRRLIDDLWALALANLPALPAHDARIGEAALLTGRALQPWRAILAVAAWLDSNGASGVLKRMEALATAYQKERPDLEVGDLTALVIRAIYAICAICAISPETPSAWDIETAKITDRAKRLIEDEELDFDPEHINSRRVGKVLGKLRIKAIKRKDGRGARQWQVTKRDIENWQSAYLLEPPNDLKNRLSATNGANGAAISVVQSALLPTLQPATLKVNGAHGGNGANGAHADMSIVEGVI